MGGVFSQTHTPQPQPQGSPGGLARVVQQLSRPCDPRVTVYRAATNTTLTVSGRQSPGSPRLINTMKKQTQRDRKSFMEITLYLPSPWPEHGRPPWEGDFCQSKEMCIQSPSLWGNGSEAHSKSESGRTRPGRKTQDTHGTEVSYATSWAAPAAPHRVTQGPRLSLSVPTVPATIHVELLPMSLSILKSVPA